MEIFFLFLLILAIAFALGSGYPVAFALPGAAILTILTAAIAGYVFTGSTDSYFHTDGPAQWLSSGVTNLRGVYWEVERDTLIAIPLFIFMGIMLQRSKVAEDLLMSMASLFGPLPGGLGISVIFVGALLAATTGIVGATVVAMGLISLPAMMRSGYSRPLATGTIAASGTLGQIIPPSIVLIILSDQLASAANQASTGRQQLYKDATGELSMPSIFGVSSTSAGEMFLGAMVPGMVLVGLYMAYILIYGLLKPQNAPSVSSGAEWDSKFWAQVAIALVPPLTLVFLVLGSILSGIATVNQAGAIGAVGALTMAGYRLSPGQRTTYTPTLLLLLALALYVVGLRAFEMNASIVFAQDLDRTGLLIGAVATATLCISIGWSALRVYRIKNTLHEVMTETAKTTSLVFAILLGAAILTSAFRAFGGEDLVREFLTGLPGGFWTQFAIVMAVIFVLGFFLEFIEIAVVVVPIVAPILLMDPDANVTAVWLGVMIGINMQTSFLTPPFGFALFYLRGVAPREVKTTEIYKGVVPFICLQLAALAIVAVSPALVNYLPNRSIFLSDNAPPARNPALQVCLEDNALSEFERDPSIPSRLTASLRGLQIGVLPEELQANFVASGAAIAEAAERLEDIRQARATVLNATQDYLAERRVVRALETKMRSLASEVERLSREARRSDDAEQARLEEEIAILQQEIDQIAAQIPGDWPEVYRTFRGLTTAEDRARLAYRRAADQASEPLIGLAAVLGATDAFAQLGTQIEALARATENEDREPLEERAKRLLSEFGDLDATGDVRDAVSDARRALRERSFDLQLAQSSLQEALSRHAAQLIWRQEAEQRLLPGLTAHINLAASTIGARQQATLSRDQALHLARCKADHTSLATYF